MKHALIFGVSGQDGAYLAQFLLRKGYVVTGTSRDVEMARFGNLEALGIREQIHLESAATIDFRSVLNAISKSSPSEIYNLSAQSSVGLSFQQPVETLESIVTGTLNILEAIRFADNTIKFYNASSSECFGDTGNCPASEVTPFRPKSPYAVAKCAAHWLVSSYRESYGLFACSGILFNHESPLRPPRFVTRKIVSTVCRIASGRNERLKLGNIRIARDWGWAPEYVDAMWRMLQISNPDDFVIATGVTTTLEEFVARAFIKVGLSWKDYVDFDESLARPADLAEGHADPGKATKQLNWKAKYTAMDVVDMMIESEMKQFDKK